MMAAKTTLVCCLMFSCFVFMTKADMPIDPATSKAERNTFEQRAIQERSSQYLEDECFTYRNHKYVLSKQPYTSFFTAQTICNNEGGYLVEINNQDEYAVIKELITTSEVNERGVAISGTDEGQEGYWTFLSGGPLPVVDWLSGNPKSGENCLALARNHLKMFSLPCTNPYTEWYPYRFLCEIPL